MNLPRDIAVRVANTVAALADTTLPESAGRQHSAIPLYADLGGAILLRADGIFLELEWDQPSEEKPREVDRPSWPVALVAGAERYPWLAPLLPERPADAANCPACSGAGRIALNGASTGSIYCGTCNGLGWIQRDVQ